MGVDLILLQADKGGDPEAVRESQRKRNASVQLVDDVLGLYTAWARVNHEASGLRRQVNALQKDIGLKMKAKEDAAALVAEKKELEGKIATMAADEAEREATLRRQAGLIGNIVHPSVHVSNTEDDNPVVTTWHPDGPNGQVQKRTDIHSHHEVMYRLDILDQERGTKVAGHRGYFLVNDGIDLNLALITYGLDFLRKRGYKKIQPPFMMKRSLMAKTAQLEEFDESLYKLEGAASAADAAPAPVSGAAPTSAAATAAIADSDTEKYLIATSEQPISAYHANEWFDSPSEQLPLRYAGYSTCFRKEAGSHGKETWGLFRIHQFEKVEQFCITDPASSWAEFETMLSHSEAFYQSLKLPYRVVEIVSGALNNAAAKKCDLEAYFPAQGEYKELVSVTNATDYQSRSLEVRCGIKKQGDPSKVYVHMLNGTLCATERALCCVVENYQTAEGLVIPEVLRPYMQGRDFLPYVRELAPTKAKAAAGKR